MNRLAPADGILIGCILLLLSLSVVLIASASMGVAQARFGDSLFILRRWLVYIPIGLAVMWLLSRIDVNWWRAFTLPPLLLALACMVLVLIPGLGTELNGARRWFSFLGLTVQPVEWLKPVIILYVAHYLAAFPDRLARFATGLAPMLFVVGIAVVLLLLQPDFGNAALLVSVCLGMWFVGGVPLRHLLGLVAVTIPLGLVMLVAEPYRLRRLFSFVDPWADPLGSGYQLLQSMFAFGVGGVEGVGLGQGVQKLFYLPEPFTDFIAAVLAEELGLGGILALIAVFAVILWRGFRLSYGASDDFSRLLVLGCTLCLGLSFAVNLGAATGMLPTKGMPMPLVSYGGSALINASILLGLTLSVHRHQAGNRRQGNHS